MTGAMAVAVLLVLVTSSVCGRRMRESTFTSLVITPTGVTTDELLL
jgi:hypothetical protein